MARQIPDLPEISANEIRSDDAMIIRDVSSQTDKKVTIAALAGLLFPVGYVMAFADDEDHSAEFGLEWERYGAGKVLVGKDGSDTDFDTVGETGGEKTHKLTISEMPKHDHSYYSGRWAWAEQGGGGDIINSQSETSYGFTRTSGKTGGDGSHNNLQPYIVVSFWRRTA